MEKTLVFLDPVMRDGMTPIPNTVLKSRALSLEAKALFSIFLMLSSRNVNITESVLAEMTGSDIEKIYRCVDELQQQKLIREVSYDE